MATAALVAVAFVGRSLRHDKAARPEAPARSRVDTAAGTLERETIVVGPNDINAAMAAASPRPVDRENPDTGGQTPGGDQAMRRAAEGKRSEERHGDIAKNAERPRETKDNSSQERSLPVLPHVPTLSAVDHVARAIDQSAQANMDSMTRAASIAAPGFKRPKKLTLTQF
jgi:hypothetical protein